MGTARHIGEKKTVLSVLEDRGAVRPLSDCLN